MVALQLNKDNKNLVSSNHRKNSNWALLEKNEFWNNFFFRIGNGESLRGVSKDLGIPFQTIWSAIMIDERRKATYEDAKMSRAHFHAARIEELIEEVELGNIDPQVARVSKMLGSGSLRRCTLNFSQKGFSFNMM